MERAQPMRASRRFSPVNFNDVTVTGDFWRERLDTGTDAQGGVHG